MLFDIKETPAARYLEAAIGAPQTHGWRTGKRLHHYKIWTPQFGLVDKVVQLTGRLHHAKANWSHLRGSSVLMAGYNLPNIWHNEGEEYLVKVAFDETLAVPANHYIGLDARVSLAEADVLTTLTGEPTVGGYARQAVPTTNVGYATSLSGGNWQAKTTTEVFTPSGADYPAVTKTFLTDQATGTVGDLYCSVALSASRTVLDGDSLNVDITISISE